MDQFVSRKRRRVETVEEKAANSPSDQTAEPSSRRDEDSTDVKLAILASLHPDLPFESLMEVLLTCEGSVEAAAETLNDGDVALSPRKKLAKWNGLGYQSSLSSWSVSQPSRDRESLNGTGKSLTKKGKTLYLYSPEDVEAHAPCTLIHNFLPKEAADAVLRELLADVPHFWTETFQMFERTVQSPHTFAFYVDSLEEMEQQKTQYTYNGSYLKDVKKIPPAMKEAGIKVQSTVNEQIQRRIREYNADGKKLKYQSPREWTPNVSFVNCYDGGEQSVGYHSDQLTYLGPRPIIGSLSLGVAREFRIRKIVARDAVVDPETGEKDIKADTARADAEGQISIHLPHNSLLIMHADMQEEWKHSIAPAQAIDPHPIAGKKRINITYRCYRESFHPKYTPKCRCNIPTVLRCVQRKKESRGKYMWMCHAHFTPGQEGCSFFQWAEFDDDGEPPWAKRVSSRAKESNETE